MSEKTGDDITGDGTEKAPYKTALRSLRDHKTEPLPNIMVDAKEDNAEKVSYFELCS